MTTQTEMVELFAPLLKQGAQRRKVTDYAAVVLLAIVLVAWGYSIWRSNQVPKIESITIIPNSVVVIGPAGGVNASGKLEFCPGDTMTVQFEIAIEGEGTIYADDAVHHRNHTVKYSDLWRDIVTSGTRSYQDPWTIPAQPEMMIDGGRAWVAGEYTRVLSIAASNIYVSRYVPPATFRVPFTMGEGC